VTIQNLILEPAPARQEASVNILVQGLAGTDGASGDTGAAGATRATGEAGGASGAAIVDVEFKIVKLQGYCDAPFVRGRCCDPRLLCLCYE
jgi:hypothetical protein